MVKSSGLRSRLGHWRFAALTTKAFTALAASIDATALKATALEQEREASMGLKTEEHQHFFTTMGYNGVY